MYYDRATHSVHDRLERIARRTPVGVAHEDGALHVRRMPHIKQIPVEEATGFLRKQLDAALERAGRVWHIVHVMSLNPRVMDASMGFYAALMFGRSPLTRVQREMLAVVTSKANDCFY